MKFTDEKTEKKILNQLKEILILDTEIQCAIVICDNGHVGQGVQAHYNVYCSYSLDLDCSLVGNVFEIIMRARTYKKPNYLDFFNIKALLKITIFLSLRSLQETIKADFWVLFFLFLL